MLERLSLIHDITVRSPLQQKAKDLNVPRFSAPNTPATELEQLQFLSTKSADMAARFVAYYEELGMHAITRYDRLDGMLLLLLAFNSTVVV